MTQMQAPPKYFCSEMSPKRFSEDKWNTPNVVGLYDPDLSKVSNSKRFRKLWVHVHNIQFKAFYTRKAIRRGYRNHTVLWQDDASLSRASLSGFVQLFIGRNTMELKAATLIAYIVHAVLLTFYSG